MEIGDGRMHFSIDSYVLNDKNNILRLHNIISTRTISFEHLRFLIIGKTVFEFEYYKCPMMLFALS